MNKFIGLLFLVLISGDCSIKNQREEITLKGVYQSVKGVKDPLSCYCFNAGYLITTESKNSVPICFKNNDEEINCINIVVTGYYGKKKINPEPTNPCASGELNIFYASSYKCD